MELLKETEIKFIKEHDTYISNKKGYNLTFGGDGSNGFKMPVEKINKGENHYMFGKPQSNESNKKRSESMKLIRKNTVNPFTTLEARNKISEYKKKNPNKRDNRGRYCK